MTASHLPPPDLHLTLQNLSPDPTAEPIQSLEVSMNKISLTVLTLMSVLTTAGLVLAGGNDGNRTLDQIAGYRQWTRINPELVKVMTPITNLTFAPAGD